MVLRDELQKKLESRKTKRITFKLGERFSQEDIEKLIEEALKESI